MATTLRSPASLATPPTLAGRFGPNWYAAVMGTAIVGNAAATLPWLGRDLTGPAAAFWTLSLLLLAGLGALRLLARRDRHRVRHLTQHHTAVFYGCPPMALMAVGFGALTAGRPLLGTSAAVGLDAVLWTAGTVYGLAVAGRLGHRLLAADRAGITPTWLLPFVAPMVSAALGPALLPHLPAAGQWRETLLALCVAMFGMSLLSVVLLLPALWGRRLEPALVPTLFLVLGPLGQSVTAVGQFGQAEPALRPLALAYGVPVIGFALLWLGLALGAVLRRPLPFAMTWWAFTFPLGTCVTGAAALFRLTGLDLFGGLALALFALLLAAWLLVASRTARGLSSRALP